MFKIKRIYSNELPHFWALFLRLRQTAEHRQFFRFKSSKKCIKCVCKTLKSRSEPSTWRGKATKRNLSPISCVLHHNLSNGVCVMYIDFFLFLIFFTYTFFYEKLLLSDRYTICKFAERFKWTSLMNRFVLCPPPNCMWIRIWIKIQSINLCKRCIIGDLYWVWYVCESWRYTRNRFFSVFLWLYFIRNEAVSFRFTLIRYFFGEISRVVQINYSNWPSSSVSFWGNSIGFCWCDSCAFNLFSISSNYSRIELTIPSRWRSINGRNDRKVTRTHKVSNNHEKNP